MRFILNIQGDHGGLTLCFIDSFGLFLCLPNSKLRRAYAIAIGQTGGTPESKSTKSSLKQPWPVSLYSN